MSVADQLVEVNNVKVAIKNAIELQGVDTTGANFEDYPDKIMEIEGCNCDDCITSQPTWTRPSGWPDIEAIFNASTMPNKRFIMLFQPGSDTWTNLALGGSSSGGSRTYETSDGGIFTTNNITHNWNPAFDIDTGYGYSVRWVIVGNNNTTGLSVGLISGTMNHWSTLMLYCGSGTFNALTFGNSTDSVANKSIRCIQFGGTAEYLNNATLTGTFTNCTNLECFQWISSATTTNYGIVFQNCYNLYSTNLVPDTVTTFSGGNNFGACRKLKINIPTGLVTSNVNSVYADCNALCGDVIIPSSLTTLANSAFLTNSKVTSITVGPAVTGKSSPIHTNVFMRYLLFHAGTYSGVIGDSWTSSCYSLREITIPEGITGINSSAFANCYMLSELNLPSTLTTISNAAFSNAFALTSVTFPAGMTSIGNAFSGSGIMEFTYPTGLVTLSQASSTANRFIYTATSVTAGTATTHNSASLEWLQFVELNTNLTLNSAVQLSRTCLKGIIASLKDNTGGGPVRTLTLGSTLLAKLSAADIAVGTAKNWTIN